MTFLPTDIKGQPACCFVCGRHAIGIGIGTPPRGDPKWLCELCVPLIEHLKTVVRFDMYEHNAVAAAMEAVGPLVEEFGTDLSSWDGDQVERFVREIWIQCGTAVREQARSKAIPF